MHKHSQTVAANTYCSFPSNLLEALFLPSLGASRQTIWPLQPRKRGLTGLTKAEKAGDN